MRSIFDLPVAATCGLIVLARIADVTFGTLRTLSLLERRRYVSWGFAFLEVVAWLFAAANVIEHLHRPAYAVSYALGYATGTWIGIAVEERLAYGHQLVRIVTREADAVAAALAARGHRAVWFRGGDHGGPLAMLLVETPRRDAASVERLARGRDPACRTLISDLRPGPARPARWLTLGARRPTADADVEGLVDRDAEAAS